MFPIIVAVFAHQYYCHPISTQSTLSQPQICYAIENGKQRLATPSERQRIIDTLKTEGRRLIQPLPPVTERPH